MNPHVAISLPGAVTHPPTLPWSHARTVLRECCKGDDESQWERGKFDPATQKPLKGTLHSVEKTLMQKAYCVYYYILKERRFFMSINSVVDFSLNFK